MIGEEFKKQLLKEGINPESVKSFISKYNKKTNRIITIITLDDDAKHTMSEETVWYAARKNKRW